MYKFKKMIAGIMSICIATAGVSFSPSAAVMAESKIETESEWEVVSGILDDYTGIYTRNTMLG